MQRDAGRRQLGEAERRILDIREHFINELGGSMANSAWS